MASPPSPHPAYIDLPAKVRALIAETRRLRTRLRQTEAERDDYKRQIEELCSLFDDVDVEVEAQPQLVEEPTETKPKPNPKPRKTKRMRSKVAPKASPSRPRPPTGRYLDVLAILLTDANAWWTSTEIANLLDWPEHVRHSYRVANYLKKGRDVGDIERNIEGATHFHRITQAGRERTTGLIKPQPQPQPHPKPEPSEVVEEIIPPIAAVAEEVAEESEPPTKAEAIQPVEVPPVRKPKRKATLPPSARYLDVLAVMVTDPQAWWTASKLGALLDWPDHLKLPYQVEKHLKLGFEQKELSRKVLDAHHYYRLTPRGLERAQNPTNEEDAG